MPIDIPEISATRTVTVTKQETIKPVAAWVNQFSTDASSKAAAPAVMEFAPFAIDADGVTKVFADELIKLTTRDLFEVAKRIPSVADWLKSAFVAAKDLIADHLAKEADLEGAVAAAAKADQAEADAMAARQEAFAARKAVDDPTWVKVDEAWKGAAKAKTAAAAGVVSARLAIADAANPRI